MAKKKPITLELIRRSEEILDARPQLKDLHNLVSPEYAAGWKNIGAFLGLSYGLLNIIEHDCHHKAEDCCNAVWEQWLDMGGAATWYKVIQAIDSPPVASLVDANKMLPASSTHMDVVYHANNHMQKFYIKERYKISEDDWPPYQPEHFTSVALIHHKEKHTTVREVIAVATKIHKGSVEVVGNEVNPTQSTEQSMDMLLSDEYFMGCQSTKDIAEIFAPLQKTDTHSVSPNFVLIEGAPGIGKTILSKEIAFQWANKNILTEKLLLFLIFLRDPFIRKIESLQEFVAYAICSSLQNENVSLIAQYLENTSGNDVTIVLDGYDEISLEIRHNSFIAKIINRKVLRLCGLVITSRPTASAILHSNVDRRVEILGFTKEDRMKYISQSLKGNPIEIMQLETYLENNPFINSLCYIPLNMTILMCIFKEVSRNGNYTLPKNQTEINDQFICITISRFLRKKGTPMVIKCLAELPLPYKQHFKHLSRLAFELLGKDEVVFNDNDMKEYSNWSDLGLLKVVRYSNCLKDTPIMSYNFLHFTLQEFLAAYYVTSLSTLKQISVLKHHFWDSRYLNSWVMYVGLTSGDSFALKHFLTGHKFIVHSLLVKTRGIAIKTVSDKVKCLYLFQCFLEARNYEKCQQVGSYLVDEKIDLSNTTLLPKDMHTLSFFLTRSTTKQWKLLDLSKCYIGDNGCDILANLLIGDDKTNMHIDKMNFSSNHLTSRSICTVLKIVQYFNVKELILTGNLLDSEAFLDGFFTNFIIQQELYHEMLLSIQTNKNKILVCALNCKDIIASPAPSYNYLYSTSEIYSLSLWNTTFKVDNLLMLLSSVNTFTSIELNIYRKDLDSQILYIQSEIHKTMAARKDNVSDSFSWHLKVSYLLVSPRQVLAYNLNHNQIIQIMKHSSNFCISVLDLTNCVLSDKSLCTLGSALSVDFKEMKFINLSGCCMEDVQCEHFCKALFSHSSVVKYLEEFNLSYNKLTNASISLIVESLEYCAVKKLVVSHNTIQENAFRDYFRNTNAELTMVNSSFKMPLLVINDILNLQCELKAVGNFSCFADVYIFKCDACCLPDCLVSTSNNCMLPYRIIFLSCSSMLTINFHSVTSLLDSNSFQQIEIYEINIPDDVAVDYASNLDEICHRYVNLNVKYILAADTKLLANKCSYEELKELSLSNYNLQSVSTLQLTSCACTIEGIVKILNDINMYTGLNLLDLSRCDIGDHGCNVLCTFFNYITRNCNVYIEELNLSSNSLTSLSITYIVHLLQCCAIEKLVLSNNHISSNDFNEAYFNNRYETCVNSISNIPLLLVNTNDILNFTIYFVNLEINNKLIGILNSLTINRNFIGTLILVNTSLQVDFFSKIIPLLQIHKKLGVMIVESNLKYDVATCAVEKVKFLLNERGISGYKNVHYFLLSENSIWTNSINETIITKILVSVQFLHQASGSLIDIFQVLKYKNWENIDFSNCNIGDDGCADLLHYFISLKSVSSANVLNLSNNKLSSSSAETISKLIVHAKLNTVVISHNELKESHVADTLIKTYSKSNVMHSSMVQILSNGHAALVTYDSRNMLTDELFKCPNKVTYFSMTNSYLYDDENEDYYHADDDDDDDDHYDGNIIDYGDDDDVVNDDNHHHHHHNHHYIDDNKDDDNDLHTIKFSQPGLYLKDDLSSEHLKNTNNLKFTIKNLRKIKVDTLVASELLQYSSLVHFEVTKCEIQEKGLFKLFSVLEVTSSLHSLILNSIEVTNDIANKIAGAIEKNSHLEKLNLTNCILSEGGMNSILTAVNKLSFLKYFNLSNCFHPLGKQILPLSPIIETLEYLNISNCKVREYALIGITQNLSSSESLKNLDISGNGATDEVANHVAVAIRGNKNLECLNVSSCCISEHGLFVIFNALSHHSSLAHIDVSLNRIPNTLAEEIANVISHNTKLAHINLHKCDLHAEVFMKIMLSLEKQSYLNHLDFSYNEVNSEIVSTLCLTIINNVALEYLNVSCCNIAEQGIKIIAESLKHHVHLKHFNISRNYISHSSAKHITSAVSCYTSLEHLDLSECGLMDFRIIDIWLCHNSALKVLNLRSSTLFQMHRNSLTSNSTSTEKTDIFNEPIPLYIEHLDMSSCNLSGLQLTSIAKHLQTASKRTLKYLDLSHNRISHRAALEIAYFISSNSVLEKLILSNCGLTRSHVVTISKALKQLSRLQHLDISHNMLAFNTESEIAFVIDCNPFLEYLNLSNCQLTEIQIISIAKALSKKSRLLYLDISHNKIGQNASIGIASVIINSTSLQHFNLSGCELQETALKIVANSLVNITSLVSLDVSNNSITSKTAQSIAIALSKNVGIKQLYFCSCFMNNNAALTIFNTIKHQGAVTHLCLKSNVITDDVSKLIATMLRFNHNIMYLDLGQCSLQEDEFITILRGLTSTTTLHHLNFESNNITKEVAMEIASIIHRNTSLKELNFSNCDLSELEIQTIFRAINEISSVEHLNMSGNMISDCVSWDLKNAMHKNNKMEHLEFSGCKISKTGLCNLLIPLSIFKCMRYLNLRSCFINERSATELLPAVIGNNNSLHHLDLTDCKLQEKGLISIAKTLQRSIILKSLSLSSNIITDTAASEIALAVSKNILLQHLALSDCKFNEAALIEIAEALCTISSLKHLDLSHNVITDASATTVAMGVANNSTLQYLDLRFCKWGDTGIAKINEVKHQISMIKVDI